MMTRDKLIAWINAHDGATAIAFRDGILVTSWAAQQIEPGVWLHFEETHHIASTFEAARSHLGY